MLLIEGIKLLASSSVLCLCGSAPFKFLLSAICPIYFLSRSTHLHNVSVFITSRWLTKFVCFLQTVGERYLVDFLLWVGEERREMAEGVTVEHHLGLFVCAGHNVPNSPQGSSLHVERKRVWWWHKEDFFRNTQYACSTKKLRQISLGLNSKSS